MTTFAAIDWEHIGYTAACVLLWILCVLGYALWLSRNNRKY
jgi:hypothetical protein